MTKVTLYVDKPAYYPGELVKGTVRVECEKPQKIRGIMLEATGYEQTRITESHGVGKSRHTHTYISNNFLLRYGQPLLNECELPCGQYDYPFEYALPPQALPTYHGFCSKVMYTVTANVDIPYWFDAHQSVETPVLIPSSQVPIEHKPATLYSPNASDTTQPGFMMTVARTMFFSGEVIKGNFMLSGTGGHTVRKVDVELQLIEQAVAQGHSRVSNQTIASAEIPGEYLAPGATVPFEMIIPSPLSTVFNGIFTKVWYALVVNLDVAWAFDTTASLPLIILERA
jgi:sporulation-control protein spo0M